jgi:hypothetical protein
LISDIVATDGPLPDLRKRDQYPAWDDEAEGRGSLVWFNQASMIQSAETGHFTLHEAKAAGKDANTDFKADADLYFSPTPALAISVPSDLVENLQDDF